MAVKVKLIVRNIPRSARDWELWDFLSRYCEVTEFVIKEDSVTERRWALIEVGKPEPDDSDESDDEAEFDDPDDRESSDRKTLELDDRKINLLIAQLDGLVWKGKKLKVRRR